MNKNNKKPTLIHTINVKFYIPLNSLTHNPGARERNHP